MQFDPIAGLLGPELGRFWERRLRSTYPRVEQRDPIDQVLELERAPAAAGELRFSHGVPAPRYFFINEAGTNLVQLQSDRISTTWRRAESEYEYPRYESLRAVLLEKSTALLEFVEEEKLGDLRANQCEVLYVNAIRYVESELPHRSIGHLIRPWSADHLRLGGAAFEDVRIHARHVMRDNQGAFRGRIHLNVDPGYRLPERLPLYRLQLTARGRPKDESLASAFEFLDSAHSALRGAFSEVVEDDVQRTWMNEHGS